MGAFDKIVAAVSPRRACEREAWRQQLEILRGYDAAGYGRLNAGWRVHNESAEVTDRFSRDVVRARARDLERNSDIAQSILHAYKRNVVGKGYTLQAKTGNDELDEKLEKAWRQWCKARNCDVTGEQSFNQMLRMAVDRKKVDGGLLFLYRYTKQGLVPFQLQAIEVDELDVTASKPKHQGNRVVGGIEYNQWRRPVGYWINQYDIEEPERPRLRRGQGRVFLQIQEAAQPAARNVRHGPHDHQSARHERVYNRCFRQGADRGLPGRIHQAGDPKRRFWPRRHQNAGRRNGL